MVNKGLQMTELQMTELRSRRAVLKAGGVAAAGAVLAACTSEGAAQQASTTPSTSSTTPSAPPSAQSSSTAPSSAGTAALAPVGDATADGYAVLAIPEAQITAAVARLDALAADVMDRTKIPGLAIAVVHGGKVVYAKGFGVKKVGEPDTVNENTVFQLASVSKSIGSTVVAKTVTDKTVAWTDPVQKYLPDFQLADPEISKLVTIGDLYSHRSGIPGGAGDDLEGIGFGREDIIAKLRLFTLTPFRISYNYTNFGMTTGGEAVATAAGKTWEDLSQQQIYGPLGMNQTSSRYSDFLSRDNRATIHFGDNGTFAPLYTRDADAQSPAGGVSSNVADLATWLLMNLASGKVDGNQLIDPDALLAAHTPQIVSRPGKSPIDRSAYYGYGFNAEATSSGHVKWGHSGAFYVGAGTAFAMIPAADVGIVALTNASPVGAAETITTSFTDLVRTGTIERDWLDDYFGPIFAGLFVNHSPVANTPAPTSPAPARPAADYVGTYTNDYAGDVVVTADGDTLTVTVGPTGLNAPLTHYDGDVFTWLPPGGNGDPLSAVTFAGNPGGPAGTIQLEFLDARGLGTFARVP